MVIVEKIKRWIGMLLRSKAKTEFNVESITSPGMDKLITRCESIYKGNPEWLDPEDGIKTINFAKTLCSETARLTTLAIGVKVDGSSRASWLQSEVDKVYFNLRHWVEYGCAYGTIILKPNGDGVDLVVPGEFIITEQKNGEITGAIFRNQEVSENGKKYYTRLEYHRFLENGFYAITNKCYVGNSTNDYNEQIDIKKTPWAHLEEHVEIKNLDKPLFGVFRTPPANNVDIDSPSGMPMFAEVIEELLDLDIAYSRNSGEIKDSQKMVLLDSDRLLPSGKKVNNTAAGFEHARTEMKLPHYVKNVYGDGKDSFYQEINPELHTEERIKGINQLLSQIGFKVGYSNGHFVFNEKTGVITATEVESDQQRTIQTIKDLRDKLEDCLNGLLYALNAFADLYELAPVGVYEVVFDFGDITYNREEDRARWYSYAVQGKIPFWYYLVKFEGLTEEDAKALELAAQPLTKGFFGEE